MTVTISKEERKTLELEYQIAYQMFHMQNSQAWQTFTIVSTLALGGLAFIGQLKENSAGKITWPASLAVGLAMVIILVGWLLLAKRWWAYARLYLSRMEEIENLLGMHLIQDGGLIRLTKAQVKIINNQLSDEQVARLNMLKKQNPKFPNNTLKQQTIAAIIIFSLSTIWILYVVADIFSLI